MVRYVAVSRKLPTGEAVECRICLDKGMLYHNTKVRNLPAILKDRQLSPKACIAKVISFSRDPNNYFGGPVRLMVREKDVEGRGKKEMCYLPRPPPQTEREKEMYRRFYEAEKLLREFPEVRQELPDYLRALLGVLPGDYAHECEVALRGCFPLDKIRRVDYVIGDVGETIFYREFSKDLLSLIDDIEQTKRFAEALGVPFGLVRHSKYMAYKTPNGYEAWVRIGNDFLSRLLSERENLKPDGYWWSEIPARKR